jgi:hypothetical protein
VLDVVMGGMPAQPERTRAHENGTMAKGSRIAGTPLIAA